jgi:DNA-binding NarL/FixJ family response regulator
VFCADDHAGFRNAVRNVIAATPGFVLVGEASSGKDAIVSVPQLRPDLVLLDAHMPGMSGYEAAAWLVRGGADLVIVLMSVDPARARMNLVDGGTEWAVLMKSELCPRRLRELWRGRTTSAGS